MSDEEKDKLLKHDVPEEFIEILKRIRYLYPKGQAIGEVINHLRIRWYMLNYLPEIHNQFSKEPVKKSL